MQTITTIGLDIAKSVFQVHGIDGGQRGHPPAAQAALRAGLFQKLSPCLDDRFHETPQLHL
jgi:transposase